MESDIPFGKGSNIILAEGKRGLPFGFWWLIAGALLLLALLGVCVFFLALSAEIDVPNSPAVTVIASQKALSALPDSLQQGLPDELKNSMGHKTKWPIIFGLFRENQRWNWFMVGPVWMIKNPDETHGLAAIVYKEKPDSNEETRSVRYGTALANLAVLANGLSVKVEPALLADATGLDLDFGNDKPITGTYKDGAFVFNIAFEGDAPPKKLYAADLSIDIPKNGVTEEAIRDFVRRLSNGRHSHVDTPDLSQFHVWLDDLGRPDFTIYDFENDLSDDQAAELLAAYGFYSRKATLLPDGTLSYEHVLPSSSTEDLFSDRVNEQDELISLRKSELKVSTKNASPATFLAPDVCGQESWMRLSGKGLGILLKSLGSETDFQNLPNVQVGNTGNKLSICFE